MVFNLSGIVKILVQYVSDLLKMVAPEDITPDAIRGIQSAYALGKIWGEPLVESSANDLDNAVLAELLEVCTLAAEKYGFVLDPQQL